jgi:hypothetical protein
MAGSGTGERRIVVGAHGSRHPQGALRWAAHSAAIFGAAGRRGLLGLPAVVRMVGALPSRDRCATNALDTLAAA